MSAYDDLLAWVAEDQDIHSLTIDVRAAEVNWDADDNPLPVIYYYEIQAHDVDIYGLDGINGMLSVSMHGTGETLDEAAGHVLNVIASRAAYIKSCAGIEWPVS